MIKTIILTKKFNIEVGDSENEDDILFEIDSYIDVDELVTEIADNNLEDVFDISFADDAPSDSDLDWDLDNIPEDVYDSIIGDSDD